MFRSARWRGEKNKIKTVFKLQFHATQVLPPANILLLFNFVLVTVFCFSISDTLYFELKLIFLLFQF